MYNLNIRINYINYFNRFGKGEFHLEIDSKIGSKEWLHKKNENSTKMRPEFWFGVSPVGLSWCKFT